MRPVLYVTHIVGRGANLLTRALDARGLVLHEASLARDDPLPPLGDVAAVVCMGGHMSALDLATYPFLRAERALLAEAVARAVPVFGICLGAQLLADATGGAVERLERRLVDVLDLVPEPPAAADPVFRHLAAPLPVLEWHADGIVPPPHATVLAETSGTGCSVFRVGELAWGTQIHLELDWPVVGRMLADPASLEELAEAGVDPGRVRTELPGVIAAQAEASAPILAAFADLVVAREAARLRGA